MFRGVVCLEEWCFKGSGVGDWDKMKTDDCCTVVSQLQYISQEKQSINIFYILPWDNPYLHSIQNLYYKLSFFYLLHAATV